MKSTRPLIRLFLFFILFTGLFVSPIVHWYLKPEKLVSAVIFDKTVPNQTYREHKGFLWILNNLKYFNKETGVPFRYNKDYFGFFPETPPNYSLRHLPAQLSNVDIIYLADTYGVYTEDFYTANMRGSRSKLIYGGLKPTEVDQLIAALNRTNLLIAEFNTLASPTDIDARRKMESLLGLKWSGWIGRFFQDLSSSNTEVPLWLIENYERQYNQSWTFKGSGFALVNDTDQVIILQKDIDITDDLNTVVFTDTALTQYPVKNNVKYYYWFDIVEPTDQAEVLAYFHLDVTPQGQHLLAQNGLPNIFPAIVRNFSTYRTYYFAGDFADNANIPPFWNISFAEYLWGIRTLDQSDKQNYFFWNVYYPLVSEILANL